MKYVSVFVALLLVGCANTNIVRNHDSGQNSYNRSLPEITIDPAPEAVDPAVPGEPNTKPKPDLFG